VQVFLKFHNEFKNTIPKMATEHTYNDIQSKNSPAIEKYVKVIVKKDVKSKVAAKKWLCW